MENSSPTPAPVQVPPPCESCDCPACVDSRARNLAALLEIGGATIEDFWMMPLDDVTIGDEAGEYEPPGEDDKLWWLGASSEVVGPEEWDSRWEEYERYLDETAMIEAWETEARDAFTERYAEFMN